MKCGVGERTTVRSEVSELRKRSRVVPGSIPVKNKTKFERLAQGTVTRCSELLSC